jgi:hypothetical protein
LRLAETVALRVNLSMGRGGGPEGVSVSCPLFNDPVTGYVLSSGRQ